MDNETKIPNLVEQLASAKAEAAELRASEERYRNLFASIDEGFCVVEVIFNEKQQPIDYRFLEVNAAFVRQTGLHDAAGRTMRSLAPDHEQHWFEIYGRIAQTGMPERFEDVAAALGRQYDVFAFRIDRPEQNHVAILFRDVLARRTAEAAMQASEERLRALVGTGAASIYRMSADWRLMYELDSRDFLATTPGPIDNWEERYILPEDRPVLAAAIAEAIRTRSVFELEHRVALADGGVGWLASRAVPILGNDGEIVEWFGTGIDITARKQAEMALRESKTRQAFLLELGDALRPSTTIEEVVKRASRLLGEKLRASRIVFAQIDEPAGVAHIRSDWQADQAASTPATLRLAEFGRPLLDELRAGRVVRHDDVGEPPYTRSDLAALAAIGARAALSVPLVVDGQLVMNLDVHQETSRHWTDDDVALVVDVAERLWAAVERVRAESALRKSEARYRLLFDTIEEGCCIAERVPGEPIDFRYLEANAAFDKQTGFGSPIGRTMRELVPDVQEDTMRRYAAVAAGGAPERFFTSALDREYVIEALPFDQAGQIAVVFSDVTVARRAEARLQENERFARALMEGIPPLVWRAVDSGMWTWASPQWVDYTGLSLDQSLGSGWLAALHPDDRAAARDVWAQAEETGRVEMDGRLRNARNGTYRWFQTRATAVRDDGGEIVEWLGTSTDVDDLHQLQRRQQVLLAELQHRVRNILTVVRSVFSRTIDADGPIDEIARHFKGRLDSLARTQVVVTQSASGLVDLENLIRDELLSVGVSDGDMLTITGPEIKLPPKSAESLGLAIHELTTNALKYGAIKVPGAILDIRWTVNLRCGDQRRLDLTWTEQGVPAVPVRPSRYGFGSELIEEALPYRLGAETRLEFRGGGVCCAISVPLPDPTDGGEGALQAAAIKEP